MKLNKTCLVCNHDFIAKDYPNRITKYCSKQCWSNRKPPRVIRCLTCNKEIKTYRTYQKCCSSLCRNKSMVGRKLSEGTKALMSFMHKGKMPKNVFKSGSLHPFWIPNKTDYQLRNSADYDNWRLEILQRDNYTCQICRYRGKKGLRKRLHVDHILPWATYPTLRLDISNGRTICEDCHHKTDTWGQKATKIQTQINQTGEQ